MNDLPEPVKGRPAYFWSGVGIWMLLSWGVLTLIVAGARLVGPLHPDVTFLILLWSRAGYMCITFTIVFFSRYRINAEIAAGYSTLPFEKSAVAIVDVKTGLLIRRPTEPALRSRDDLRRARERASGPTVASTSPTAPQPESREES